MRYCKFCQWQKEPVLSETGEEFCPDCGSGFDVDMINHPPHYTADKVECIDAIEAATEGLTGIESYATGSVLKYIWRWKRKNGVEDLRKARWYLDRLIASLEGGPDART